MDGLSAATDGPLVSRCLHLRTDAIGQLYCIEYRPQHVELELQNLQRALLLSTRLEMIKRGLKTVFDVPSRLRQSFAEGLVSLRFNPRIMVRPALQSFFVYRGREQLGKRRAYGLLPGRAARKIDIGIHRETHPRQDIFEGPHVLPLETARVAQPQPRLNASFVCLCAVRSEEHTSELQSHSFIS